MFKTKKAKIIGISIIAVIILLIVGAIVFVAKYSTPKAKIKIGIESLIKQVEQESNASKRNNAIYRIAEKPIGTTTDIKISTELNKELPEKLLEFEKVLNNITIKNIVRTDNERNAQTETSLSYKGSKMVNLKSFYENEEAYILLDNLLNKYIKIDAETVELFVTNNDVKPEDNEHLKKEFLNAISKNIKDSYITSSKETVKFDKDVKLEKYTLNITKMLKEGFFEEVIATVLTDSKSHETMKKLLNDKNYETKTEILDAYKSIIENIKENLNANVEFSIYTKGIIPKTVKYDLVIKSNEDNGGSISINYIKYDTSEYNEKLTIDIKGINEYSKSINNEKIQNIDVDSILLEILSKESNDNYDILVKYNGEKISTIKGKITAEETDVDYELDLSKYEKDLKLQGKITSKEIYNDKSIESNYKITIENDEIGKIKLEIDSDTKNVTMASRSKYYSEIESDEITQTDINSILTKAIRLTLFNDITKVLGTN